jgi:hypothetical protein
MDAAGVRLALDDARQVADELESLIRRLEYVARSAHGSAEHRVEFYPASGGPTGDGAAPWAL